MRRYRRCARLTHSLTDTHKRLIEKNLDVGIPRANNEEIMHIAFQCNAPCVADRAWLSGYLYPLLLLLPHTATISLPTLSSAMSTMLSSLRYLAGTEGPSGFGSRTTAEEATSAAGDLSHITAIITGATSGIGAETARVLAKRGARLVLPARNLKAAEEARARLLAELGSDAGTGGQQ